MVSRELDKIMGSLTAESFEYKPNPIESYDVFLKRKGQFLQEWYDKNVGKVYEGLHLFSLQGSENACVQNLKEKFLSMDKILEKECEGKDAKAAAKYLAEHNLFGLSEEDFNYLLGLADKAYQDNLMLEASRMYQALTMLFPTKIEGWLNWAHVEREHFFDYNGVLRIYEECLRIFNGPTVYYYMALCHVKGDEVNLAKDCLQKAIELSTDPGDKDIKEKAEKVLECLAASKT